MEISRFTLANLVLGLLLLASPFLVQVTTSAGVYDPWSDLNADGEIDIFDVVTVAGAYLTTGDPTKNVTLSGHANRLAYATQVVVDGGAAFDSGWISVDSCAKVAVCLYTSASNNEYQLQTRHHGAMYVFVGDARTNFGHHVVQTYDVPNEEIRIYFYNGDIASRALNLDIYLIP